jgi:hypothetical protein
MAPSAGFTSSSRPWEVACLEIAYASGDALGGQPHVQLLVGDDDERPATDRLGDVRGEVFGDHVTGRPAVIRAGQ